MLLSHEEQGFRESQRSTYETWHSEYAWGTPSLPLQHGNFEKWRSKNWRWGRHPQYRLLGSLDKQMHWMSKEECKWPTKRKKRPMGSRILFQLSVGQEIFWTEHQITEWHYKKTQLHQWEFMCVWDQCEGRLWVPLDSDLPSNSDHIFYVGRGGGSKPNSWNNLGVQHWCLNWKNSIQTAVICKLSLI